MSRRDRIVWYGLAGCLVAAGAAVAAAVGSTAGQVIGLVLVGFGLVLATSLVFYEVGLSEDRARAREQAERELAEREEARRRDEPAREREVPQHDRSARVRLPRSRGRRRRIT
jgi:hypothetical protein